MHRGDQNLIAQPSVFKIEGPMCRLANLIYKRTYIMEPDRHVQVKSGLTSAQYPVELVESFLKVIRQELRATKNFQMWLHSQLDRHHMKIVWQRKSLSTTCVAECFNQKELGSPSFERTWMQQEP